MTSKELTRELRVIVDAIDGGDENIATIQLPKLKGLGLYANMHVGDDRFENMLGKKNEDLTEEERMLVLEWYGGSIVDIIEKQGWFAMNSIINCRDNFAPKTWL